MAIPLALRGSQPVGVEMGSLKAGKFVFGELEVELPLETCRRCLRAGG